MHFLTDFADQAVLAPLALCVAGGLAVLGWRRGARAWMVAVTATLASMLVLKLLLLGCPGALHTSPSGHTAGGTVIYGGLAALWLRRRVGTMAALVLGALPMALLFAATRLALRVHTLPEVLIGASTGLAGVALLLRLAGPAPAGLRGWRLAVPGLAVMVALHGARLPLEARLHQAAGWLPGGWCGAKKDVLF